MLRKALFLIALSIAIISCGGSMAPQNVTDSTKSASPKLGSDNADSAVSYSPVVTLATSSDKGALLIIQNDCRNCHREREKLIGPAFSSIAVKYTDKDIDQLATKVIKGGSGIWGDISMAPHPSLTKEDAKKMIAFIFEIK
ncbi:cytochrome c [Mucilaginibacter lappiensis]|uniref:Cytochrome c n=1 Tax=Mucilaginibacter lappiensis TaxID=354630 RepID=A0ABR6PTF3_9SPHI|nr:c-type cytochrome [Mucilaginibacter lappiensis]MBB6113062.1 cytochrome c [Mucilaginibacter lappiensis]SIS10848.1 cytochrome c [Mucilaginibacter lappiensis]